MKIGFCPGIEHKAVFKAKTTKELRCAKPFYVVNWITMTQTEMGLHDRIVELKPGRETTFLKVI